MTKVGHGIRFPLFWDQYNIRVVEVLDRLTIVQNSQIEICDIMSEYIPKGSKETTLKTI